MLRFFKENSLLYYLLIFLAVIPVFVRILRTGYYPMQDDFQVIRTYEVDKCVKDGQFPCRWVPDMGFGYGYPEFNYYAPLPYYMMELIHLVGFSFIDSVKVFIILITFVSAFGMYALAMYLWKSSAGALLSTLLYVYLPFRAVDMYVRGAIPELAAMAIIPFLFLFASKMVEGEKRSVFWFSISAAVLFLTHNIATLIVTPVVCLWTVFLIVKNKSWKSLPNVITGFAIGIGLSAFFAIPAWLEKGYVHIDTLTSGYFNYLAHFVSLKQMLLSTHWGYGASELGVNDDLSLSVGISQWILATIAVIGAAVYRKHKYISSVLFLFVIGFLSLFLMHDKSSIIWEKVSVLSFIQFPWRFLMLGGFCFSIAAGAVALIQNKVLKFGILGIGALATLLLYAGYFQPKAWLNISDADKLSGTEWTKAITASLYDFLPVSAKKAPDFEAKPEPVIIGGKAEIVSGSKGTDWQTWKVKVLTSSAALELQIYYFPVWNVKVDGREVVPDHGNIHGLMDVALPMGEHNIEARLTNTTVRSLTNALSLVSLLALGYVFIKAK